MRVSLLLRHYYYTCFRIDIPANRYDMLCVEGIARAVKTFLGGGSSTITTYSLSTPDVLQEIHVSKEVMSSIIYMGMNSNPMLCYAM